MNACYKECVVKYNKSGNVAECTVKLKFCHHPSRFMAVVNEGARLATRRFCLTQYDESYEFKVGVTLPSKHGVYSF